MSAYLGGELAKAGVDDAAIVEYCVGLLVDDSMDADEKEEAIVGYLESATEADLSDVVRKAIALAAEEHAQSQVAGAERARAAMARAAERERAELQRDAHGSGGPKPAARQLTAAERQQREEFLKRYGFDEPEIVEGKDGEAEIVYREARNASVAIEGNNNAQIVADKQRAARESDRLAHQKKVEREKELLEKDRLRKDKERRRTMKNEKRRM
ncbi:hypothetical protein H4R21_001135 [Coemansia helicoidea]|uniref:Uncharacterized protein n=1 Tax=Coemansia helicoidea TaxID=1286919 RepID=A0ACC1LD84_9FUNG|nr:hypothetical protein H4R21_001135 [Coemansia helicoidea]